jgi:hypothetical protein
MRSSAASCVRTWTDFDAMELNTEWIEANLGDRSPRLLHAMLAARASE